ncbi:DUF692 domain-containing protein [Marinomonas spartinae]|uniref:MNIO family bufferin maturase n=1 Tax=Marinomonas spartinae TaxID=1792290 RepID=UPI0018F1D435|nr:DUF692 domain-containing protein [Marinomonas spartinae]MBJ7553753.1 DUF692 domain-containing protein [Marinomonas spartinae]
MSCLANKAEGALSASSGFLSRTGISLKPVYYQTILTDFPEIGFFEIHAENYLSKGGPAPYFLAQIREHYPITVHGVGLSIGGESPLDVDHLERVATLVETVQPEVFSEHLAWSSHYSQYLNDLLPVPYDQATLDRVCRHIDQVQERLQRPMLLENPSTYFEFARSNMSEVEFLSTIAKRTGCGLLLDVNNVEVSCFNRRGNPYEYLNAFPMDAVGQIHLAGHTMDTNQELPLKIDSHDDTVSQNVWGLYQHTLRLAGDVPTLIERDGNLPSITELLKEAQFADEIRQAVIQERHHELAL